MSARSAISPQKTEDRPGDAHLKIVQDDNDISQGRGTKRYYQGAGPQPAKVAKRSSGFLGSWFTSIVDWFSMSSGSESDVEIISVTSNVIDRHSSSSLRSSESSSDVYYEGVVSQPDIICTTARKSIISKPVCNTEESQEEEVEYIGEVNITPIIRNNQDSSIHEEDTSSDSISIISDALNGKGNSPGPDDSVSRQNTPTRNRPEDFQTPKDSWSRQRRFRDQQSGTPSIRRIGAPSTPTCRGFQRTTNRIRPENIIYHTPKEYESLMTGSDELKTYEKLLKQMSSKSRQSSRSMFKRTELKSTNGPKPLDYVMRAKAIMRRHRNQQPQEATILNYENRENCDNPDERSNAGSESASVSSYRSSGREKVDDLIASISNAEIKTSSTVDDLKKYKNDKKYSIFKEKELKETDKQIKEIRNLHEYDLVEDIKQKLWLSGIRPPIPRKPIKEEFPVLSKEIEDLCDRIWGAGRLDEVFATGFDTKITRKDLLTLAKGKWLNDEVISFFLNLIVDRSNNDKTLPKVYTFNTFFYVNISTKGYASVKRWTRKVDIFSYDVILIPVHVSGVHWCMAVVDFTEKTISYFDPMHHNDNGALDYIQDYIRAESNDKRKVDFDFSNWKIEEKLDCPQQQNGHDCGVFSTRFAEYCSRRAPLTFSQTNMEYFRKRMVYEIVSMKLM